MWRFNFMMIKWKGMKANSIGEIKVAVKESVDEMNLSTKIFKVFLFGSFARGEQTNKSDIDLWLVTSNDITSFEIGNFRYLIKEKTGRDVDIGNEDFDKLDPDFISNIRKDLICIYESDKK